MQYYIYPQELYHHGIKGQKWGVRRFQNEDGSLTDAGVKRQLRLEHYREREKAKLAKRYKVTKLTSKANKALERYGEKQDEKSLLKAQKALNEKYKAAALKRIEMSRINKMSYDDMNKEKKAVVNNGIAMFDKLSSTAAIAAGGIVISRAMDKASVTKRLKDYVYDKDHLTLKDVQKVGGQALDAVKRFNKEKGKINTEKTKIQNAKNDIAKLIQTQKSIEKGSKGFVRIKGIGKDVVSSSTGKWYLKKQKNTLISKGISALAATSAIGAVGASAVRLGLDIKNGAYKTSGTVKSNIRLTSDDRSKAASSAYKKAEDELRRYQSKT